MADFSEEQHSNFPSCDTCCPHYIWGSSNPPAKPFLASSLTFPGEHCFFSPPSTRSKAYPRHLDSCRPQPICFRPGRVRRYRRVGSRYISEGCPLAPASWSTGSSGPSKTPPPDTEYRGPGMATNRRIKQTKQYPPLYQFLSWCGILAQIRVHRCFSQAATRKRLRRVLQTAPAAHCCACLANNSTPTYQMSILSKSSTKKNCGEADVCPTKPSLFLQI